MRAVAPSTHTLRGWQRRALVRYLAAKPRDFLAVATPGSGKTRFALRIATELLADGTVDKITVVVPTEHLKVQWAQSATSFGLSLDPRFSNSDSQTSSEYHGVVVTYAQVASHPTRHRVRTENHRTLVIFDEIHHAGDAKSWGEAVREAFDDATRRLSLTGTPFRSDDSPIPFINYEPDGAGYQRSQADHTYGYSEALADGVVRPVVFMAYSGEARWRDSAGEEHAARLGEPLSAEQTARAWRTTLDPNGEWIPAVLRAAHARLLQKRKGGMTDAGAMIIATDQKAARAYAKLLTQITGSEPTVVLSDDPKSSDRIAQFSASTSEWMVAVRMVSEGLTCRGWPWACTRRVPRLRCSSRRRSGGTCGHVRRARRQASSCRRYRRYWNSPACWKNSAITCSANHIASRWAMRSRWSASAPSPAKRRRASNH